MSQDTTPTPPSMASGSTSPASRSLDDTVQLTPRSKIRALIASGSDSDESIRPRDGPSRRYAKSAVLQSHTRPSVPPGKSHSSSDDGIEQLLAPRGKVAARLRKQAPSDHQESGSDNHERGDVYSRIKRKLARTPPNPPVVSPPNGRSSGLARTTSSSTDEDGVLPIVRRRKKGASLDASKRPQSPAASTDAIQPSSPGLFLTPDKKQTSRAQSPLMGTTLRDDSESDQPADPQANSRFLALVARKREERKAKAEAEAEKKAKRLAELRAQDRDGKKDRVDALGVSEDDSDLAGAEKLTQSARPTRKASKRALEKMNRETQRMNRNMQLAHQARTKKKITKESLFARFNFRNGNLPKPDSAPVNSSSTAPSSNPVSDFEARPDDAKSPPTSPVLPIDEIPKTTQNDKGHTVSAEACGKQDSMVIEEDLPDVQTIIGQSQEHRSRAAAQTANDSHNHGLLDPQPVPAGEKATAKKHVNVRSIKSMPRRKPEDDSESDLEVLPVSKSRRRLDVFDRIPATKASEVRSLQTLRALAHLTPSDDHKTGKRSSMSLGEMQYSLQKRARQQAARERAEKIQELKDRGVIIQTVEERQKDQAEVEDLLEKARREATELKQKEKEKDVAKKQAKANGETPLTVGSSDEDEDYQENDADESEVEFSGSEEEGENDSESGEAIGEPREKLAGEEATSSTQEEGGLIEYEASEVSDEDEEGRISPEEDEIIDADTEDEQVERVRVRRGKNTVIDDEDEEDVQADRDEVMTPSRATAQQPFDLGLPPLAVAPIGMTQAFALTMADSQTQGHDQGMGGDQEDDSLAFLGAPPEPELPVFDMDDSPQIILDSQAASDSQSKSQTEITFDVTPSQIRDANANEFSATLPSTQMSDIPDPTQDVGFQLTSPVAGRYDYVPPSTVDPVILPPTNHLESPIKKTRGRLRRKRAPLLGDESDISTGTEKPDTNTVISVDAFDVLKKGQKKASKETTTFDKKKSNAHDMVEEQAQESEDEYAGLGGASDEESGGEEDEEVRKMIEQGEVDVDEGQLAAFYANKERASDEKAVEKLFKDINNGMLRRKRGAEFDLSDSENDAESRRRRKRREFAKMRKALLENENLGKIAEDPKKMAFLRAIEDRQDDEDLDFLDQPEQASQPAMDVDSQEIPDSQPPARPDSAAIALGKRKRPLAESVPDAANRPPPAARRTPATSKPQSLAEIRASVSFLIEEPDAMHFVAPSSSPPASDNEAENDENSMNPPQAPSSNGNANNPLHPHHRRTVAPVIDRLSLKRSYTASTTTSNLFFHAPTSSSSSSSTTIFKVPSLLRRATTSSPRHLAPRGDGAGGWRRREGRRVCEEGDREEE
ncbi:MAG: hypothetical protein Q9207_007914 [Kuettlingeria erythrocarpa]